MMGMGLDQDEYLLTGLFIEDCLVIFKQYKALKRWNETSCLSNGTEANHLTKSHIYKTISMMGPETRITTYDFFLRNQIVIW